MVINLTQSKVNIFNFFCVKTKPELRQYFVIFFENSRVKNDNNNNNNNNNKWGCLTEGHFKGLYLYLKLSIYLLKLASNMVVIVLLTARHPTFLFMSRFLLGFHYVFTYRLQHVQRDISTFAEDVVSGLSAKSAQADLKRNFPFFLCVYFSVLINSTLAQDLR